MRHALSCRTYWVIVFVVFGWLSVVVAVSADSGTTIIAVDETAKAENVKRLGLNIGDHTQYGAAQYLKNLIPNPGFEAGEYSTIFNIDDAPVFTPPNTLTINADNWNTDWNEDDIHIGQPVGFWNGASIENPLGDAENRTGTVTNFLHSDNKYTFELDYTGVWPQSGAPVFVTTELPGYQSDIDENHAADTTTTRPGSDGTQSLRLFGNENYTPSFDLYFDTYGRDNDASAGKLIVVDGEWYFSIWAKAEEADARLNIRCRRIGENIFLDETVELTTEWQLIERTFEVATGRDNINAARNADGTSNALAFELTLTRPDMGDVLVDDVTLERANQTNATVFTDHYVSLLEEMQPGIIRNWGSQLGSSLDNQLSVPFARKTTGYSPRYRVADQFHYSLHEFLELCQLVGAEPWYVIPPTFSSAEIENLTAYLTAPVGSHPYADVRASLGQSTPWSSVFNTIHLELGNELWAPNDYRDPFWGGTMGDGILAGSIANDRFGIVQADANYDKSKFNLVIGGQVNWPGRQEQIESNSSNHTSIGLAPYFGSVEQYDTAQNMFEPLYELTEQYVTDSVVTNSIANIENAGQGTQASIYEVNLHAVSGDVPLEVRNQFLSGQAGGIALPLMMLKYQSELGIENVLAYRSAQFSKSISDTEYARLFGLMRDLEATGRKRPTWLGLELANRAIGGTQLTTTQTDSAHFGRAMSIPYVQSYAYNNGGTYSMILFNLDVSGSQSVQLDLGQEASYAAVRHELSADSPYAHNEDAENVTITSNVIQNFTNGFTLELPPHSMTVLEWTKGDVAGVPSAVQLQTTDVTTGRPPLWTGILASTLLIITLCCTLQRSSRLR